MKGKRNDLSSNRCAIARALNIVGDWWSLLIIRDALHGLRRFGEFQKHLGLAKNILAARLHKLVDTGILETTPAADGSPYNEYVLTPRGEELYVVLVALWQWGEKHAFAPGEQQVHLVDSKKRKRLAPLEVRARDGHLVGPHGFTHTCIQTSQATSKTGRQKSRSLTRPA